MILHNCEMQKMPDPFAVGHDLDKQWLIRCKCHGSAYQIWNEDKDPELVCVGKNNLVERESVASGPIPFDAPAYVHSILDAWLNGTPLDFKQEPVPLDALSRITKAMDDRPMPRGLCHNREDHEPHKYVSETLGTIWCHADQSKRQPHHGDQLRKQAAEPT